MRLEFEPNVTALPLVENEVFDQTDVSADVQTLLKKGTSAAQAGDRVLARDLLMKVTELDSKNEDAWMWLASISEYPEELLGFLNKVLEINPNNPRAVEWHSATRSLLAKTFVQRGENAHAEGSVEQAVQCFDKAIEHDADCEQAWFWKAKLTQNEVHREGLLKRVLSINVDNHEASEALAAMYASRSTAAIAEAKAAAGSGDNSKALEILDTLLDRDASNTDAWILRAHLTSDLADKLHSLGRALDIDPDNAVAKATYEFLAAPAVDLPEVLEEEPESEYIPVEEMLSEPVAASPFDNVVETAYDEPVEETVAEVVSEHTEPEYEVAAAEEADVEVVEYVAAPVEVIEAELPAPTAEMLAEAEADTEEFEFTPEPVIEVVEPVVEDEDPAPVAEETFAMAGEMEDDPTDVENLPVAKPFEDIVEEKAAVDPYKTVTFQYVDQQNGNGAFDAMPEFAADDEVAAVFEKAQEAYAVPVAVEKPVVTLTPCPFCWEGNEPQAFECGTCRATLTLADIDTLFSNDRVDRDLLQNAVTKMEAEWNLREFDSQEMVALGIGHFNLQNYPQAMNYLHEASRLAPNDFMLSGQINALGIRLEEVRRQNEARENMPRGRNILVVDDSATVRKLISGKLEKSGHSVTCAEDGVEGLARIAEQIPDLVLLDITMPRMDGYEVCRQIRANPNSKDVPVVMISGKDGFFDKVRGRMAGTTAYITKPFGPETLMKALDTYLVPESVEVQ